MFGAALDELKTNGIVVENYGRSSKQNRKFILYLRAKERQGWWQMLLYKPSTWRWGVTKVGGLLCV